MTGDAAQVEEAIDERIALPDELRAGLVQDIAMIGLFLAGWCEPPNAEALHLSTLIQQLLSAIAQLGGIGPAPAYQALCGPGCPFTAVTAAQFAALLRDLGSREVITQSNDGLLLHGPLGERTVNHYSFFAAFPLPDEYRVFTVAACSAP